MLAFFLCGALRALVQATAPQGGLRRLKIAEVFLRACMVLGRAYVQTATLHLPDWIAPLITY